ncbi:phosphodiester glycosidase family protein [Sphingobacterium sp. SGR-19]|uniref:phosphodiester glycosidase family protein n=1 Tax=Sphingobacterium sp. SGR-19 TaxID=2710886 RepID=UPI0013EE2568|nr:phosphodiester glycosidase family protein [Sphingobacterium sp. SGR-19]NGM66701.1 phosphodiester glycosidase family protein [Sphingobacterium sp. SGR-19]
MKGLYISIYIIWGFLLFSCKQEGFQKSEQNPADYAKLVRISELVYLYELDNSKSFAEPSYMEATVNGVDNRSIHVQDGSDVAIRIFTNNASAFNVNDLVRVKVGGESLILDNAHYVLSTSSEIAAIGFGSGSFSTVTLENLTTDIHKFTSKVVNINDVVFKQKEETGEVTSYLINQDIAPDLKFWVNIPVALGYDMPMSISSARGFLVYESGNVYINVRTQDDIQEVYVEPTMIEKLLNNSTLIRNVVQSTEEEIAPGVKMGAMSYINNSTGVLASCTVLEADLNNPKVRVEGGSPNDVGPPYTALQNLTVMATHKNNRYSSTDWRVLAAITGDIQQGAAPSFVVRGPVVRYGAVLSTDFWDPTHYFFGIKKNEGTPLIGNRTEFEQMKDNLEHAVGGIVLLQNGEIPSLAGNSDARAAIGYSANNKVYLFVGNGRHESVGNGYTRREIAELLKALGCEGGLYLMEGGASVGILEDTNSGSYKPFSRTHATNPDHNPPLASSWMIVTERD